MTFPATSLVFPHEYSQVKAYKYSEQGNFNMFPFWHVFILLRCCLAWLLSNVGPWEEKFGKVGENFQGNSWREILPIEGKFTFLYMTIQKELWKVYSLPRKWTFYPVQLVAINQFSSLFPDCTFFSIPRLFHRLENWKFVFLLFPDFHDGWETSTDTTNDVKWTDLTLL